MAEIVPYILALPRSLHLFDTDPNNKHNTFLKCLLSHQTVVLGSMIFRRMVHKTVLEGYLVGHPLLLSHHILAEDRKEVFD